MVKILFDKSAEMLVAILFLPVKVESEYLTAKGPKPSGTFQRKPPRVYSKFITLWNSSTWTALFSPAQFVKQELQWTSLPSLHDSLPRDAPPPKVPPYLCTAVTVLSVCDSQGTHRQINPVSPVWNLQDLAFREDSLII